METFSSYLADHIRPVIDKKYHTRSDAADDLGIDQAVLSRICSGKRFGISEYLVENICLRLGLDPAEGLLRLFLSKNPKIKQYYFGLSKKTSIEIVDMDKYKPTDSSNKTLSDELFAVPFVAANALLFSKSNERGKNTEYMYVPVNFLPKSGDFVALNIKGDSMLPAVPDGSVIVINLSDTQESDGSIFVFKYKGDVKVGRAVMQDNFLQMCPDNLDRSKFPSHMFDVSKPVKDSPLLGKVVWSLRKF